MRNDITVYRWVNPQQVAYTGTSAASAAISDEIRILRLVATTACFVKFGTAPTATTSDHYLPANSVEYVVCSPGEKVAAVQGSSGGTLHITEATS